MVEKRKERSAWVMPKEETPKRVTVTLPQFLKLEKGQSLEGVYHGARTVFVEGKDRKAFWIGDKLLGESILLEQMLELVPVGAIVKVTLKEVEPRKGGRTLKHFHVEYQPLD